VKYDQKYDNTTTSLSQSRVLAATQLTERNTKVRKSAGVFQRTNPYMPVGTGLAQDISQEFEPIGGIVTLPLKVMVNAAWRRKRFEYRGNKEGDTGSNGAAHGGGGCDETLAWGSETEYRSRSSRVQEIRGIQIIPYSRSCPTPDDPF
jgi:hypothetical protein